MASERMRKKRWRAYGVESVAAHERHRIGQDGARDGVCGRDAHADGPALLGGYRLLGRFGYEAWARSFHLSVPVPYQTADQNPMRSLPHHLKLQGRRMRKSKEDKRTEEY